MSEDLLVYDRRERWLVRLADAALRPLGWFRGRASGGPVRRVLLMRLERIGDLLMVLDAIGDARAAWPGAEIDLAIGGWNAPVAALIPGLARVEIADAPWLARDGRRDSWRTLIRKAREWRGRRYDVVVNFEPDIRSNLLAWIAGAPVRAGYSSGGGGRLLTDAGPYPTGSHVSENARALIARAAGGARSDTRPVARTWPLLAVPDAARRRVVTLLGSARRPLVGVHASGGRESKQWHLDRFAAVARAMAQDRGATIVLTGSEADRPLIDEVRRTLTDTAVIDLGGALDLPSLAALFEEIDVFISGDTGPMHLAAAMGAPVVALFGPSHPERYGPRARTERILRVDLPCSPCGQVRLPPRRCRGHVPECLDRIDVATVVSAAIELLDAGGGRRRAALA